jgi:hypothetical protein
MDPTVRFSVALEKALHEQLKAAAELNRRSVSAQAAICIERDLARIYAAERTLAHIQHVISSDEAD